jgi:hypothetical protein
MLRGRDDAIDGDGAANSVAPSTDHAFVDPIDTMPVAELEVQPDWHPDEHVNTVDLGLDFVMRFVLFAFGVLLLTIAVGSLVLIGFAVIVGYTAVLVGRAVLVRLTRHEPQVA